MNIETIGYTEDEKFDEEKYQKNVRETKEFQQDAEKGANEDERSKDHQAGLTGK